MRKVFLHSWKRYVAGAVICIAITILYNSLNNTWNIVYGYMNGLFIGGFTSFCFGLLSLVENLGAFDIFSYIFAKKGPDIHSLYDYVESKRVVREKNKYSFVPYVCVGILSILISTLLNMFI